MASSNPESKPVDKKDTLYNELDSLIGHFGWYQIVIVLCISSIRGPFLGMNGTLPVFANARPNYRCKTCVDSVDHLNVTEQMIDTKFYEASVDDCGATSIDHCTVQTDILPQSNSSDVAIQNCCYDPDGICQISEFEQIPTSEQYSRCSDYVFDHSVYKETVVTEFNLVCGKSYLADLSTSVYYAGMGVGSVVGGLLAVKFGRKPTILAGIVGCIVTCIWCAYVSSIEEYIVTRFFMGAFIILINTVGYVYVMEIVGARARAWLSGLLGCSFTIGALAMAWPLAYYVREWRHLQLLLTVFAVAPLIPIIIMVPESYRWLITRGESESAIEVVMRITKKQSQLSPDEKVRAKELVIEIAENTSANAATRRTGASYFYVFKYPQHRLITLNLMYQWFINSFTYWGLSLNAGHLPGSDFMNSAILSAMEFPAHLLCPFLIDWSKMGRRGYVTSFTIAGAMCCILSTVLLEFKACDRQNVAEIAGVTLAYLGKFFFTGTFQAVYMYAAEIYSTDVRPDCIAMCSVAARVGGIIAPFIIGLSETASWLPGTVFGATALVGGVLAFFLPETLNQPMLYTIEEAERRYAAR